MEDVYKEVYFNKYCKDCKHINVNDDEDPCNECLAEPYNIDSHKPINYKEDERRINNDKK